MLSSVLHYLQNAGRRLIPLANERPVVHEKPADPSYRIYTTEFDEVVDGRILAELLAASIPHEPLAISPLVNIDHDALSRAIHESRTNAQAISEHLRRELSADQRADTIVSLLVDQSGSLRGVHALVVAELVEGLADALTSAEIATDVLGFTTSRWRGGRSRQKWQNDGQPPLPGRLNDLLHIVHLDGTDGPSAGPHHFPALRHERVFKENIDGEALEWAHERLVANQRRQKVLIVLSDGAPVDDSTLYDNWPTILSDHLKMVASRIASSKQVVLGAIGIEHDVSGYFALSAKAPDLASLATVAPDFVKRMLTAARD